MPEVPVGPASATAAAHDPDLVRIVFWITLVCSIGSGALWVAAELAGTISTWDHWGIPMLVAVYASAALVVHRHPARVHQAALCALAAASIFCLGAVFHAATRRSEIGWASMASTVQFMPMLYVAAFIMLRQGAAWLSWLHYAGLVTLYPVAFGWPWMPTSGDPLTQHLWISVLASNPAYILALHYVTQLKGRLSSSELAHHQSKERFLAMLSHEIRSPLQAMLGSIDLLALKARSGSEKRAVDRLRDAATQLEAHLRDVTEYTRLENPAWALHEEPVDLLALAQDLCDQMRAQAESRGLKLILEIDDPAPSSAAPGEPWTAVRTDARRLRQVLANLLNNAIKYTPVGQVVLRLRAPLKGAARPLSIEVEDTGIGIAPDVLTTIFQPYVRLEDPRVAHEEGSGLGLALVRLLTERLGLKLTVDSQPERGSVFRLSWPPR
jgi:signal transduction histidine kinase